MFLGLSVYYLPPPIEWEFHKGRTFAGLCIPVAQQLAHSSSPIHACGMHC